MSGGGTETPVGCEAAQVGGGGGKKKDSQGFTGSPAHLIIKDLGEIHSRLLDHRPVIQGETRYFVKEFEEKRGLREMRVLENLKNMIHETNEHTLPTCRATMQDSLNQVLQRLQAATDSVRRLQQREQERKKVWTLPAAAANLERPGRQVQQPGGRQGVRGQGGLHGRLGGVLRPGRARVPHLEVLQAWPRSCEVPGSPGFPGPGKMDAADTERGAPYSRARGRAAPHSRAQARPVRALCRQLRAARGARRPLHQVLRPVVWSLQSSGSDLGAAGSGP
uniref:Biogenesis of lysosome-related organelles complex 1 subunit 5 n=1 Tax=Bos indicus x Bos taurus TaxID=30522 RepID=A0A4W2IDH3_BOBOX